jgi:hypothetical protein
MNPPPPACWPLGALGCGSLFSQLSKNKLKLSPLFIQAHAKNKNNIPVLNTQQQIFHQSAMFCVLYITITSAADPDP